MHFQRSLKNKDNKLSIQQNDLQPFTNLGDFNFIVASHFSITGVYDGLLPFSMNLRSMYAKISLKILHLCSEIFSPNFIKALKTLFTRYSKCFWCVEKITSSNMILYLLLFGMVSSTSSLNCCHIASDTLRPIASLREKYVDET